MSASFRTIDTMIIKIFILEIDLGGSTKVIRYLAIIDGQVLDTL